MQKSNPINIRAIDHVVLRTEDLESMVRFYCDVLGCRLERGPGDLGLAQLRAGACLIDLVDANGPLGREGGNLPDREAPNMDHFCLQVEPWDNDVIRRHLENAGVQLSDTVSRYGALGQGPSIYLSDPDGNTVELKGR
jgi:glyoxylase I family protein